MTKQEEMATAKHALEELRMYFCGAAIKNPLQMIDEFEVLYLETLAALCPELPATGHVYVNGSCHFCDAKEKP